MAKKIQIFKIQFAYAVTKDVKFFNILNNIESVRSQRVNYDDAIYVHDDLFNIVTNIYESQSKTNNSSVYCLKTDTIYNMVDNINEIVDKFTNYTCITSKNYVFTKIWNELNNIVKMVDDYVKIFNYTIFKNTHNDNMCFVSKTLIDTILNFEKSYGFVLGFFKDSYDKFSVDIVFKHLKFVSACQTIMYENNYKEAKNIGLVQIVFLFGKRSNNNKMIYVNKDFFTLYNKELEKCISYKNEMGIDISNYEYNYYSYENCPVIHLTELQANNDLINTEKGKQQIEYLIDNYDNKFYQKVLRILSTHALPYDAKCVSSLLKYFVNKFNAMDFDDLKNYLFDYHVHDKDLFNMEEYKELSKMFLAGPTSILDVWQYLNDFVYEICARSIILKYDLKRSEEIDNNGYTKIFKKPIFNIQLVYKFCFDDNDNVEYNEENGWCDYDCNICAAKKYCDVYNHPKINENSNKENVNKEKMNNIVTKNSQQKHIPVLIIKFNGDNNTDMPSVEKVINEIMKSLK